MSKTRLVEWTNICFISFCLFGFFATLSIVNERWDEKKKTAHIQRVICNVKRIYKEIRLNVIRAVLSYFGFVGIATAKQNKKKTWTNWINNKNGQKVGKVRHWKC